MVEHDEDCIRAADYLIDIGPGAGAHGGQVVADGTIADSLSKIPHSITVKYLTGELAIAVPAASPRKLDPDKNCLELKGCRENNLKNIDVQNSPRRPDLHHRRQRFRQIHAHQPDPPARASSESSTAQK